MKPIILITIFFSTFLAGLKGQELSREFMRQSILVLTSDSLAGRRSGSEQEKMAAVYIRDYFASLGLELLADKGLQTFEYTGFNKKHLHSQNVIAKLEGNDPDLKNQSIVIGGHYDHLGDMGFPFRRPFRGSGICYGADDNASGTAMVMELARYYSIHREALKRSIIFVTFGSEEQGLFGSKKFTSDPPAGTNQIFAMLNFDMVGRLDKEKELFINGRGTAAEMDGILGSIPNPDGLNLVFFNTGKGPTDSESFYRSGVPVVSFITGLHSDYHTPRDVEQKINYDGMKSIGQYALTLVNKLESPQQNLTYEKSEGAYPKSAIETTEAWKFQSHLAGVHFGMGGLMNVQKKISSPSGFPFLKSSVGKSPSYGITFISGGLRLVKNFGITGGLGFEVQNFSFSGNIPMSYVSSSILPDSSFFRKNIKLDHNSLRYISFNIPVMFELKSKRRGASAFISAGVIGTLGTTSGLRLRYEENNHRIEQVIFGKFGTSLTNITISARAGYKHTGIYANYQLTSLFKDGAPELFPFSAGLCWNFRE